MPAFQTPVDISNRCLQHLGAKRITSFGDDSKNALECSFAYDKLRRAELRRNVWRTAIRRTVIRPRTSTTVTVKPVLWQSSLTYLLNQIVSDALGNLWISVQPANLNNAPGNSAFWQSYFGSLTADVFSSTTSYWAGELVYTYNGNGTYGLYRSLVDGNISSPLVSSTYDPTLAYNKDDVVFYNLVAYKSLTMLNKGNTPSAVPILWASGTTYATNALATGSDNLIYKSLNNSNTANDPTTDGGVNWQPQNVLAAWTTLIAPNIILLGDGTSLQLGDGSQILIDASLVQFGSTNWVPVLADILSSQPPYPLTTGPLETTASLNAYRLPANFLRKAPQNPKAGSVSFLGAPSGAAYTDWLFESDYIVTRDSQPFSFRFIADITDVTEFDDMFCEGLALRMAMELCETITQSNGKLQAIAQQYKLHMGEARLVNAIETGAVEPPEDDWVTCRL